MLPTLVNINSIFIPTYLALNSLAFSLAVIWAFYRAPLYHFKQNLILDVALVIMISGFIGARLTHILWEEPKFYFENPLVAFEFWKGGFVFYGGAITAFLFTYWFSKIKKFDWKVAADIGAPTFAMGYAIGRLGCFAAGCCFGKPANIWWAVVFPEGAAAPIGVPIHPTQIYATLWELSALVTLLFAEKKRLFKNPGQLFGLWLVLHGIGRMVMEKFRDDFRGPSLFNLSLGTGISFFVIAFGLFLILNKREPHHASSTSSNRIS